MKFMITDEEHETAFGQSLHPVPINCVTLEKEWNVHDYTSRGGVGYMNAGRLEEYMKQVFICLHPIKDEHARDSITGAQVNFDLETAIVTALSQLAAIAGTGGFNLWVMGRRIGQYTIPSKTGEDFVNLCQEIYHIIDDEMAFNREEWGLSY